MNERGLTKIIRNIVIVSLAVLPLMGCGESSKKVYNKNQIMGADEFHQYVEKAKSSRINKYK